MEKPVVEPGSESISKSLGDEVRVKGQFEPEGLTEKEKSDLLSINVREEYFELIKHLENQHAFFYQMWAMGAPRLTFDVPTAAVTFNKKGHQVEFLFNPIFWKSCDLYKKLFVICHECLHVLLNHGARTKNCEVPMLANIALDVVVNHLLCDRFGFDRDKVEGWKELCWLDTTFKDFDDIDKQKCFEYYYGILEQNCKITKIICISSTGGKLKGRPLDDHGRLDDFNDPSVQDEIADALDKGLSDDEKQDLAKRLNKSEETEAAQKVPPSDGQEGGKQAGSLAGRLVYYANVKERVKKKRKWETVIMEWSRQFITDHQPVEQWARLHRRLLFLDRSILLPSEFEDENKDETKIDVYFFQDTSGSCAHFRDRFFKTAKSLPEDRFNLHLYCFDTSVYPVDIKEGKLRGFGGTSFSAIETFIQGELKAGKITKYPAAVFMITDGYGDVVTPERPRNWYWFLSDNYRHCIPKESNVHLLKDFE